MTNKNDFTKVKVEKLLSELVDYRAPDWGMMTPQHMVEHLTISVKASTGRTRPVVVTSAEQIESLKQKYIGNDDLWERGMKNPLMPPDDRLMDLKYENLDEAKEKLIEAVDEFEQYYKENPEAVQPNPFLGYMNYDEWLQFHYKHFRHHFMQFGLLKSLY